MGSFLRREPEMSAGNRLPNSNRKESEAGTVGFPLRWLISVTDRPEEEAASKLKTVESK